MPMKPFAAAVALTALLALAACQKKAEDLGADSTAASPGPAAPAETAPPPTTADAAPTGPPPTLPQDPSGTTQPQGGTTTPQGGSTTPP
jgi:hypothetical protein